MTLYITQLTFYHRDPLTDVDLDVLKAQVVQYTCLQAVTVFWTECQSERVLDQLMEEDIC